MPLRLAGVDYVVCAAYKWLLCPRGAAFLAVHPGRISELTPHHAGWYAGEDVWSSIYGTPLRLASSARRFDLSPAWFCWTGAAISLELLAGLDMSAVRDHDVGLAREFADRLGIAPRDSAIVTVDRPGADQALAAAGVRAAVRAGRVRAAFHLYNDSADVKLAADALSG